MSKPIKTRGRPLEPETQAKLRRLVSSRGTAATARFCGVESRTIIRCVRGLTVYPGTGAIVALKLAELTAEALT
jgi:hypothetical protein